MVAVLAPVEMPKLTLLLLAKLTVPTLCVLAASAIPLIPVCAPPAAATEAVMVPPNPAAVDKPKVTPLRLENAMDARLELVLLPEIWTADSNPAVDGTL